MRMNRKILRGRGRWVIASSLAIVLLAGGVAFAVGTIPGEDGVIHGCYNNSKGTLRVIDATTDSCNDRETAISWNQQGVPGADGTDGADGTNGIPVSQTCPEGDYVSGIGSDGSLTCTPLPGAGPSDPDNDSAPQLVVSLMTGNNGRTMPGQWTVASGFIQFFNPLQVQAVDASGTPVADFSGTVALNSSCPLATEGGASHTYTGADAGSFTFSIGLGDNAGFGATMGVYPSDISNPGVVCTVTATDTTGQAIDGSQDLRAAGEFCDGVDNNANGNADEAFPEKGSYSPDQREYVCSTDGMSLTTI
jgi:hypothetical protein